MIKTTPNDGGPAFPRPAIHPGSESHPGMSLRDKYAGDALKGMLADNQFGTVSDTGNRRKYAYHAFLMANDMLAARAAEMEGGSK